jgi:CubicO group peptidase (beta-lactamase class C family)
MTDLAACLASQPAAAGCGIVVARWCDGTAEAVARGPVSEESVFELGSITKVVTGLLLAVAVVRGEVTLETPLEECLPGARARAPITLGRLASHTAGLPRLPLTMLRRRAVITLDDPYAATTTDELLAHLARVRVRTDQRLRYSNFGFALLGQALAAAAGRPYEQLVHERVLGPLGVDEVWAFGGPEVAQPHRRGGRPVRPWRMGAYAPAGCLHGSARGVLALSLACLEPPAGLAEAVTLALSPLSRHSRGECGLGWMRSPLAQGRSVWWHNGATQGSRAFTAFDPGERVAVAATTNTAELVDGIGRRALAVDPTTLSRRPAGRRSASRRSPGAR